MRTSSINRKTAETDIAVKLNLDGTGKSDIDTGMGFFDHMLTLFASHGKFDLTVKCKGDLNVDCHHSVEDIGIVLGQAFKTALGDKVGIARYGYQILPMDEALLVVAIDISGRGYLGYNLKIPTEKVGDFDTEMIKEFYIAFSRQAEITLHVKHFDGQNSHHIIEGAFKCTARALKKAVKLLPENAGQIPSTKGVL